MDMFGCWIRKDGSWQWYEQEFTGTIIVPVKNKKDMLHPIIFTRKG